MLISTGCLPSLAPIFISGSHYSNFIFNEKNIKIVQKGKKRVIIEVVVVAGIIIS